MEVAAIIAEYNPLHNGHAYQIEQTKKDTGADYVITFMSGDFVQRGAPALLDKYTRTRMALLCGADAVIELPTLYAAASAEYFAQGAVTLMSQLGVVDLLSFGSESGDLSSLTKAAELLLSREPADLTQLLKKDFLILRPEPRAFLRFPGICRICLCPPTISWAWNTVRRFSLLAARSGPLPSPVREMDTMISPCSPARRTFPLPVPSGLFCPGRLPEMQ